MVLSKRNIIVNLNLINIVEVIKNWFAVMERFMLEWLDNGRAPVCRDNLIGTAVGNKAFMGPCP